MVETAVSYIIKEKIHVLSKFLRRDVEIEMFLPKNIADTGKMSLLLINDGQDMPVMQLDNILEELYSHQAIEPVCCQPLPVVMNGLWSTA